MKRDSKGWPVHDDGSPMRMGELPIEEQKAQLRHAAKRICDEIRPALAAELAAIDVITKVKARS